MSNEEQYLREKVGQRNPFRVPDNYFGHLTARVMQQLPERRRQRPARRVALRPWLYAAACVVAAIVMTVAYYFHQDYAGEQQMMAATVTDNSYMDEAADYAMLDNMEIYACLSDN